jgi:hypothetical protein
VKDWLRRVLADPRASATLSRLVSCSRVAKIERIVWLLRIAWLLPLVAVACGTPDTGPPVVFDPCKVTTLVAAPDSSADERAGISEAIALWSSVGGPPLALAPAGDEHISFANGALVHAEGQFLPVFFQAAAPVFNGLYDPGRGDIFINRGLTDARARAITVAHELGHAFGLAHENARRSLMSPGNLVVPPGETEVRLIDERRGSCD